jgi:signal-transduction protein with cAMP-binding, CBS, and nucleotidyltransferase domain
MTVERLIKRKGNFVSIVRPHLTVDDVIKQLEADDVSAVVVSGDDQDIFGIVSPGDIVRGLKNFGRDVGDRPVSGIMTCKVVSCDIKEPLTKIYELMDKHQIRHVPITEQGRLCGIINILDVISYRLAEIQQEAEALKDYVAGRIA